MEWLSNLIEMKKASNKTTKQISEATGIPKSTLDKLFSGQTKEPYLEPMRLIVHYLGYSLDDLVGYKAKSPADDSEGSTHISIDARKHRISYNYDCMNEAGRELLAQQSDIMAQMPQYRADATDGKKQA